MCLDNVCTMLFLLFFFSSRRRHTRCALVTGVQTCALPIYIPDEAEVRARWGDFRWTPENADKVKAIIARYPPGRQQSAVMPLLDLAQRQVGVETNTQGWLPVPVIEFIAEQLGMPYIRAFEVATFYTMYNLAPDRKRTRLNSSH